MSILLFGGMLFRWSKNGSVPLPSPALASEKIDEPASTVSAPAQITPPEPSIPEAPTAPANPAQDAATDGRSPAPLKAPEVKLVVKAKTPPHQTKPEVIIRGSIDGEGRGHSFQVLRGDQALVTAALNAAKHWRFHPCSRPAGCEQLLKFTDYGDATSIRELREFTESASMAE